MKRLFVFFSFIFAFLSCPLFAQDLNDDVERLINGTATTLPPELQEMLGRRAAEKVKMMTDYIGFMADKEKKLSTREYYKTQALNLFVGAGYKYVQDGIERDGVTMQTTSKYRKNPRSKLMRDYFDTVIGYRYQKVQIEATDVADIKVSRLKKVGENEYECTCTFDQAFCGYRDGRPVYRDITTKRVVCRVILEETVDGVEAVVLLGDVYAIETH